MKKKLFLVAVLALIVGWFFTRPIEPTLELFFEEGNAIVIGGTYTTDAVTVEWETVSTIPLLNTITVCKKGCVDFESNINLIWNPDGSWLVFVGPNINSFTIVEGDGAITVEAGIGPVSNLVYMSEEEFLVDAALANYTHKIR